MSAWLSGKCTCMSEKPGTRYLPLAAITRAPAGAAPVPTETIRSPSTTTV